MDHASPSVAVPEAAGRPDAGRARLAACAALSTGGVLLALLLAYHHAHPTLVGACGEGSGCREVLSSRYSAVLGVPVAWIGVGVWSALLALIVAAFGSSGTSAGTWLRAAAGLAGVATLASGGLLYLQVGVVRAWCLLCTASSVGFAVLYLALPRRIAAATPRRPLAALALAGGLVALGLLAAAAHVLERRADVVARIDGEPVTEEDLRAGMSVNYHEMLQQAYLAKRGWIERIATDRALRAEAARQGLDPETLLARETEKAIDVSDEDVDRWLAQKAPRLSDDERRARARDAIAAERRRARRQAYVEGLLAKHSIEVFLEGPRMPRVDLDATVGHTLGPASAPARLVVFSEFQCPYCARLAETLKRLLRAHPEDVSLTFVHAPIDAHARSVPAAKAAECAGAQGRFWEFHDALFADPSALDDASLRRVALAAGADGAAFDACLAGESPSLDRQTAEARRVGVASVPTLFLNGVKIGGAVEYVELERLVQQEVRGLGIFTGEPR